MSFVHLHVHTEYSLLDGMTKAKDMVKKAKALGMNAVAVTEHGNLYNVPHFYKAAIDEGIKPIVGVEAYTCRDMYDKSTKNSYHLILLAKNDEGYKNIIKLMTKANLEGFYYKPRIDFDTLCQYKNGIIVSSACLAGEIPQLIMQNKYEQAKQVAMRYKSIFNDDYYIELMAHGIKDQTKVNRELVKLAKELNIKCIATNDVHYLDKEDAEAHDVLLCIQTNKLVSDNQRMKMDSPNFYFKDKEEITKAFMDQDESASDELKEEFKKAIENTQEIADKCHVTIQLGEYEFPDYEIPEGQSHSQILEDLCNEALKEKYKDNMQKAKERLDYELSIINKMGFAEYFMIVWDLINWAKKNDIQAGPCRGSVAGSIVAYLLEFTTVDPLEFKLLFERFLNPERVSMPDCDIDMCYRNRDKVIKYVTDKYGSNKVAQIITFGTLSARAAFKDVARAMGMSFAEANKISKLIPAKAKLNKPDDFEEDLKEHYKKHKKIFEIAAKVQGIARHSSVHAAGVVIGRKPLTEYGVIQLKDGQPVIQVDMYMIEDIGLIKFDFLGLRTLTVVADALFHAGLKKDEIDNIDLKNQEVLDLFRKGETHGIFQFESSGMQNLLKRMQPTSIEDLIAANALYRPGPMDLIPDFIAYKHGAKKISYWIPQLEEVLKDTYSIMVYQEQVMQVASAVAGFSMGQADILRKAMGKKIKAVMDKQKGVFIEGCQKNNVSAELGEKIWSYIEKFAGYGFNKSHATVYSKLAFQTAWLKLYHPAAFFAALMSSEMGNENKIAEYIKESQRLKVEVVPPDINESMRHFTVSNGKIRVGLGAIKNLGDKAIEEIVKNRPYTSFDFFCKVIDTKVVNKRALESIIKAGAFDSLNPNRLQLLMSYEKTMDNTKNMDRFQQSLFTQEATLPKIKDMTSREKAEMEKDVLGLYLSAHPLDDYQSYLNSCVDVANFKKSRLPEAKIGGIITATKQIVTKKGDNMMFLTLEDLTGPVEVVVFPKCFEKNVDKLEEDNIICIQGKKDEDKMLADEIMKLEIINGRVVVKR